MANEVLQKVGGQFVFADHAGDYVGGTGNNALELVGSTDVEMNPGALAAGAGYQSAKVDLGATRAREYSIMMSLEMASDPAANEVVEVHWCTSVIVTAAVANSGGCSGAKGSYAGYAASTLDEGLKGLFLIGVMPLAIMNDADGVPQLELIGTFAPRDRFGSMIIVNKSAAVAFHSDDVEFAISMQPIVDEIQ